jgi:hypothetical protein
MAVQIQDRFDAPLKSGMRKPGGLYLRAAGLSAACGKLPVELKVCPCCGTGIRPARGWTWVDADALLSTQACPTRIHYQERVLCELCPLEKRLGRAGLVWIGESFYHHPNDWTAEAMLHGVSRRIHRIPRGFKLGETWILVAHRKAITRFHHQEPITTPGIFHAFRPTAIEYVVRGDESPDELKAMARRGITPVRVHKIETLPMFTP